jgi:hypothetical protein
VLEVTGIRQLELCFLVIFLSPSFKIEPAAGAVEMWESGVRSRISKPGGKGGKLVLGVFHAFHGAAFPQRPLGVFGA